MDVKSGTPYWTVRNGLIHHYPRLTGDARCEIAVVGGGITGALVADELLRRGHDVLLLEACEAGWGSTAASTALIQGEIDTDLQTLAHLHGEDDAVSAYRACADAVGAITAKAASLVPPVMNDDAGAGNTVSVYHASRRADVASLRREYEHRLRAGLDVSWLERDTLQAHFGLEARCAILSRPAAAIDPYRMTHALLARACSAGARVHARTRIMRIRIGRRSVVLETTRGHRIRADHVVIATGYAAQCLLPDAVACNRSTYALVTNPVDRVALGGLRDALVWETARPYLYLRATADDRLVIGGLDDAVDIPARRDARVAAKARQLLQKARRRWPALALDAAFAWAGTFAETADGLPFFGPHPHTGARLHHAMAYGGNGITYSWLGAGIIADRIGGRAHPLETLFGFARLEARRAHDRRIA